MKRNEGQPTFKEIADRAESAFSFLSKAQLKGLRDYLDLARMQGKIEMGNEILQGGKNESTEN